LDDLYRKFKKPILFSEFGADSIAGEHRDPPELFTEEYQVELIKAYCEVVESKPYTIGEHIWTFADFKTAQHYTRIVLNRKGVFTRDRQPKMAAHFLKQAWKNNKNLRCFNKGCNLGLFKRLEKTVDETRLV